MSRAGLCSLLAVAVVLFPRPQHAETISEGEAKKCEERIAAVQRDVLNKYEESLVELQATFQKAADLEGALAARTERQRLAQETALTEKHFVPEPKALRSLQMQTLTRMQELIQQLLNDTVPKLIEYKKSLTVAGKLDEAVAVRAVIEQLQNSHLPVSRAEPGEIVPAETLLSAYAADRGRADKIYKGQKLIVRGTIGGFRADPVPGGNSIQQPNPDSFLKRQGRSDLPPAKRRATRSPRRL